MRRMNTRQATKYITILLTLLPFITACSTPNELTPTLTHLPATSTPQAFPTFAIPTDTPSPTPLACLTQPGTVEEGILETTKPPQQFFIYLPPCYTEQTAEHYPVLYLLHGQTYTSDQWIRLGVPNALDKLLLTNEAPPFIIVFPDDRYWNLPSGATFGERLINDLIPHIDKTYRTLPDSPHRAIGGLSRGAGWALQLGLSHPDLFSIIGLHSLAAFQKDVAKIDDWLSDTPSHPSIFMDIGDADQELASAQRIENLFTQLDVPHEWHLYSGAHTEEYWSAHVDDYLRWYGEHWEEK